MHILGCVVMSQSVSICHCKDFNNVIDLKVPLFIFCSICITGVVPRQETVKFPNGSLKSRVSNLLARPINGPPLNAHNELDPFIRFSQSNYFPALHEQQGCA